MRLPNDEVPLTLKYPKHEVPQNEVSQHEVANSEATQPLSIPVVRFPEVF